MMVEDLKSRTGGACFPITKLKLLLLLPLSAEQESSSTRERVDCLLSEPEPEMLGMDCRRLLRLSTSLESDVSCCLRLRGLLDCLACFGCFCRIVWLLQNNCWISEAFPTSPEVIFVGWKAGVSSDVL